MGGLLRLFERSPEPAHLDVAHNGEIYRIAINRSTRSRRFTLRVRAASRDVLLTMPARAPLASAREFAERHSAWIGVRLARLPRPVAFEPSAKAPLRGVDHTIVHRPSQRGVVWIEPGAQGPLLCVAGERPHVARRVADFLKREALKDIEAAVARHAKAIGRSAEAHFRARHGEPLGLVLVGRPAQLLLAPDPRAALRARLSRRPRGGAHGPHEPFPKILDAGRPRVPGREARGGLAQGARRELAQVWGGVNPPIVQVHVVKPR